MSLVHTDIYLPPAMATPDLSDTRRRTGPGEEPSLAGPGDTDILITTEQTGREIYKQAPVLQTHPRRHHHARKRAIANIKKKI